MLTLGSLTLDDDPYVEITYNYNSTSNGTIVGGVKTITLTGSIVSDTPGTLISKARDINSLFEDSDRVLSGVTIKGTAYSYLIVDSVSINDGDWVNKITYTIVLRAPIDTGSLPSNAFGLSSYSDNIKSLDINESINIEADKNGTYYLTNNGPQTINGSVRWEIKISVSCLKSDTTSAITNAQNVLTNILITSPDRDEFNEYKTWNKYLQSRSLSINPSSGSLEFALNVLLIPTEITNPCLVSFSQTVDHNYTNNTHSKKVNVDIEGLVDVSWDNIIDLSSSCDYADERHGNARDLAETIADNYNDVAGISFLDLFLDPLECDVVTPCNVISNTICYRPSNYTISSSKIDGTCNLSMEWASDNSNCDSNGITTEVSLTTSSKRIINIYNGWFLNYPIIQNLGYAPIQKDYTITSRSKYSCPTNVTKTTAIAAYATIASSQPADYYLISHTRTQDNTSYTIRATWIEACQ